MIDKYKIDKYILSGQTKYNRGSGLTVKPHTLYCKRKLNVDGLRFILP